MGDIQKPVPAEALKTGTEKETQTPAERQEYLDSLVSEVEKKTRSVEKTDDADELQQSVEKTIAETGFPNEAVVAAFDLFTSPESPFEMTETEIQEMLVKLSKNADGKQKLFDLFDATNDYHKVLTQGIQIAVNGDLISTHPISPVDLLGPNGERVGKNENHIFKLTPMVREILNRVHREGVNLEGLTDSAEDQRIKAVLEKIYQDGNYYRIQDIKDAELESTTVEAEENGTRIPINQRYIARKYQTMQKAAQEVVLSSSGWNNN